MARSRFRTVRGRLLPLLLVVLMVGSLLVTPVQALAASKKYKVKFNANGGAGTMSAQSIARKKSVKLKAVAFTRTGYAFTGWNTKKNGSGKAYANQAKVKNLAKAGKSVTLYAQWRAYKPYTVTFVANGGSGSMSKQSVAFGRAVALSANKFTRPDWAFTGWNTKANGSGKTYANKASVTNLVGEGKAISLYAQWRPTTYLVNFDANGGAGTMPAQKVTAGKLAKLSACVYARNGYAFTGWNTKANGSGDAYDNKDVIIEDLAKAGAAVTLYAQWAEVPAPVEPETYEVRFDANGGTGSMAAYTAKEGAAFRLPLCSLAREGWEFSGWNTAADGSGDAFRDREAVLAGDLAPADGAVTLYAQWAEVPAPPEPATYAVAFDANGGEGEMPAATATVGKSFRLPACALTREGYDFAGWNTAADGTGDAYDDRAAVVEDLAASGETATLYAQWAEVPAPVEPETYTIAFDANGGTAMEPMVVTVDKVFRLPHPVEDALEYEREFMGWNTEADGSGVTYWPGVVLPEELAATAGETVTLHAQWAPPQCGIVVFDLDGGTDQEGSFTKPRSVTEAESWWYEHDGLYKDGYAFAGWELVEGSDAVGVSVTEDKIETYLWGVTVSVPAGVTVTLRAKWDEAVRFTIVDKSGSSSRAVSIPRGESLAPYLEQFVVDAKRDAWTRDEAALESLDLCYYVYDDNGNGDPVYYTVDELFPGVTEATIYHWGYAVFVFDLDGGTTSDERFTTPHATIDYLNFDAEYSPSSLQKEGFAFAGWKLVEPEGPNGPYVPGGLNVTDELAEDGLNRHVRIDSEAVGGHFILKAQWQEQ